VNLFFHQAALGDFFLCMPLLRALAAGAPLAVVAPRARAAVAAERLGPARVSAHEIEQPAFTTLHASPVAAQPAPHPARSLLAGAAWIVSGVATPAWRTAVRRLAPRARLAELAPRPPETGSPRHALEHHREALERAGLVLEPDWGAPGGDPSGPLLLHPGSGGAHKRWPPGRFAALARRLTRSGMEVQTVLGEVELATWPAGERRHWQAQHATHLAPGLETLATLARGARLWIGNDAGPSHLAAALGTPTLTLLGPTDPRTWRPLGPRARVLAPPAPEPMQWLDVETVFEAALEAA